MIRKYRVHSIESSRTPFFLPLLIYSPFPSFYCPHSSSSPGSHHQNPILLTPTFIHAPGLGPNFERVRFLGERAVCCRLLWGQAGQRLGGGRRSRRLCGWSLRGVERRVRGNTAVATLAVFSLQRLLWAFTWACVWTLSGYDLSET